GRGRARGGRAIAGVTGWRGRVPASIASPWRPAARVCKIAGRAKRRPRVPSGALAFACGLRKAAFHWVRLCAIVFGRYALSTDDRLLASGAHRPECPFPASLRASRPGGREGKEQAYARAARNVRARITKHGRSG